MKPIKNKLSYNFKCNFNCIAEWRDGRYETCPHATWRETDRIENLITLTLHCELEGKPVSVLERS